MATKTSSTLSTCSSTSTVSEDSLVRTGILHKKGGKSGFFSRANWKPRYFTLTWDKLSYYLSEGGALKGELDLSNLKAKDITVMPNDAKKTGHSHSSIWRISINTPARRLLVAAASEYEMNEWLEDLREVVARHETPEEKLSDVRPSVLRPSLIDGMELLARSNPRRFATMPGKTSLRRKVMAQHMEEVHSFDDVEITRVA
ncbi:Aste57867_13863 [Aphanomyces stellatus]|uniref:Aste57867_13863 protein n=1 Tax=Aphanomyces stellatus TaxID=120398 RepID=A0A485KZ66_9STRA|nr:hypothetical protein As57867_013812 [Aphanomyces stellatus]VFT90694.1 Aste57867_13863 [Aphanomyces stellatus]